MLSTHLKLPTTPPKVAMGMRIGAASLQLSLCRVGLKSTAYAIQPMDTISDRVLMSNHVLCAKEERS